MFIEVINKKHNNYSEDVLKKGSKIYSWEWNNNLPENYFIISNLIYLNFKIDLKYKNSKEKKIVIFGECNEKFWFFKIIKYPLPQNFQLCIKKPVYNIISSFRVTIIDWYKVIKSLKAEEVLIEFAIGKIL